MLSVVILFINNNNDNVNDKNDDSVNDDGSDDDNNKNNVHDQIKFFFLSRQEIHTIWKVGYFSFEMYCRSSKSNTPSGIIKSNKWKNYNRFFVNSNV